MIKTEFAWNQVYKIVMLIKEDYMSTPWTDKSNYDFKHWLEELDNTVWNRWTESLQFTQYNNFLLVRYGLEGMKVGMWIEPNSIYRECRSITIDLKEENIVLCPFRKFFNLDEVEENSLETIFEELQNANKVTIMNKLDGSMQCARWYNGDLVVSGSRALDYNESWRLKKGRDYLLNNINYKEMIRMNPTLTFIFEIIDLADRHVVLYDKSQEGMYLIGARDVYSGRELSYEELKKLADIYRVNIVEQEDITFEEILELSKTIKSCDKEGWVIDIDGHKVKLKGDDYVDLHRMLSYLSSVNTIIKHIAEGTIDDLLSKVPDTHKEMAVKIADLITNHIQKQYEEIDSYVKLVPRDVDKKTAMVWINENVPKEIMEKVRQKYFGKPLNLLKNKHGGYKSCSDIGLSSGLIEEYSLIFTDGSKEE